MAASAVKCITQSKKMVTFSTAVVSANITSNRRTSSINNKSRLHNDSSNVTYGCMELDSHADTIVLGSNAIKSEAADALRQSVNDFGRPEKLTFDGSQEQCGRKTEFMSNIRKYSINHRITEPYRPNHNFAEGVIREIRKKWFCVMIRKNVPQRVWDYGL